METQQKLKKIRLLIGLFMSGLVLSGITAMPLDTQFHFLDSYVFDIISPDSSPGAWYEKVSWAVHEVNGKYPFLSYGTDWLAFGHFMIAIAFIGPYIDPVRNIWVIQFGIIASLLVFPMAFIAGEIRGIPFFWRIIDCCFGLIALNLLIPCHLMIKSLRKKHITV